MKSEPPSQRLLLAVSGDSHEGYVYLDDVPNPSGLVYTATLRLNPDSTGELDDIDNSKAWPLVAEADVIVFPEPELFDIGAENWFDLLDAHSGDTHSLYRHLFDASTGEWQERWTDELDDIPLSPHPLGYIDTVRVAPQYRGLGIGRMFVAATVRAVRRIHYIPLMTVIPGLIEGEERDNPALLDCIRAWWVSLGFVRIDGSDCYYLPRSAPSVSWDPERFNHAFGTTPPLNS